MDENQQELRHAATEAFMESLDQLSRSLQLDDHDAIQSIQQPNQKPKPKPNQTPNHSSPAVPPAQDLDPTDRSTGMDIHALEEAAADIEQFMQTRISQTE